MVKQRESSGRVIGVKRSEGEDHLYGEDEREVLEKLLGGSTSYVESAPTSPRDTSTGGWLGRRWATQRS